MQKRYIAVCCGLILGLISSCGETGGSSSAVSNSSTAVSSESSSSVSSVSSEVTYDYNLYVSNNGGWGGETDTADGTKENPFNFTSAVGYLMPGRTMYLLAGTYKSGVTLAINALTDQHPASQESERKTIQPAVDDAGNEAAVLFDFSAMTFNSSNRGISLDSNYWTIKDVEVQNAGDNGVYIGGNYNIVEHLDIHGCQDTGLQLGRKSSNCNTLDTWPSYNTVKNCTSHDNHDPSGEDSDGFACKLTTGVGNVFDGCIAYNNVDDGWDLYAKAATGPIGPVTIKNCVAFNNGITSYGVGTANSDGNGFKLGGEKIPVAHKVYNCIAFNNLATGFTDNSNPGTINIQNCTSYNNGTRDWDAANIDMCRDTATSLNYYKNILSYCDGYRTSPITLESTICNSKDMYKGTAAYSVFYCGLSMLKFGASQNCNYDDESLNGELFESAKGPFVDETSPQAQCSKGVSAAVHNDVHKNCRSKNGNVALGNFLKVDSSSPFYTMGENGSCLGADLSGD